MRAARDLIGESSTGDVVEIGSYGRTGARVTVVRVTVARVEAGAADLGALLTRHGLAWWYERCVPNGTEYDRLQQQARSAGRGLWSRRGPIPPLGWRDGARSRNRREGPAASGLLHDPNGLDRDGSDFRRHSAGQRFYEAAGGLALDPYRLDGDGDGGRL